MISFLREMQQILVQRTRSSEENHPKTQGDSSRFSGYCCRGSSRLEENHSKTQGDSEDADTEDLAARRRITRRLREIQRILLQRI